MTAPRTPGDGTGGAFRAGPAVAALLGIGTLCAVSIGAGLVGGLVLDRWLGTTPLFVLLGLLCGIVCAAVAAYHVIRNYLKGQR
ncbi:MAG TPA: AtpZ/AtpI family protein [Mycobacteriales bacterium]|nr:AtpZ/AtpI family protein [Mycobacteriales bacterium]